MVEEYLQRLLSQCEQVNNETDSTSVNVLVMGLDTGDIVVNRTDVVPISVVITFEWRSQVLNNDRSISEKQVQELIGIGGG